MNKEERQKIVSALVTLYSECHTSSCDPKWYEEFVEDNIAFNNNASSYENEKYQESFELWFSRAWIWTLLILFLEWEIELNILQKYLRTSSIWTCCYWGYIDTLKEVWFDIND